MPGLLQRLLRRDRRPAPAGAAAALAAAEALAAAGRHREAIAALSAANRRHADAAVEARLVDLRHEAFLAETPPPPAEPWPPPLPDVFAGQPGVPEVAAADLTAARLGAAIAHHGALIVRGLLAPPHAARLVDDVDATLDAYDAAVAGQAPPAGSPWFRAFPCGERYGYGELARRWSRESGGQALLADSPRALFDVVEIFSAIGLVPILAEHFGEWPALSYKKSTLRRTPPTSATEWHQDGAFLGAATRTLDVWVALSPCGVDAPSIDLVARRIDHLVETGTGSAAFAWSVAREVGDRVGGADIVRPVFAAGDALILDQLSLHRTGVGAGMTRTRYALEAWFFAPSTYPPDQGPLAL